MNTWLPYSSGEVMSFALKSASTVIIVLTISCTAAPSLSQPGITATVEARLKVELPSTPEPTPRPTPTAIPTNTPDLNYPVNIVAGWYLRGISDENDPNGDLRKALSLAIDEDGMGSEIYFLKDHEQPKYPEDTVRQGFRNTIYEATGNPLDNLVQEYDHSKASAIIGELLSEDIYFLQGCVQLHDGYRNHLVTHYIPFVTDYLKSVNISCISPDELQKKFNSRSKERSEGETPGEIIVFSIIIRAF
tara:strand:+ start:184 stop:924 length:741 start_codon:yes stop_codon:yes gene_type:complete